MAYGMGIGMMRIGIGKGTGIGVIGATCHRYRRSNSRCYTVFYSIAKELEVARLGQDWYFVCLAQELPLDSHNC